MQTTEVKASIENRELLNATQSMQVLGVSRYLFNGLVKRGDLKPASPNSRLYRRRDLVKILTGEGASNASRS